MKKVNPKWIKISDEIEKQPKKGVIVFIRFKGGSKLEIFETDSFFFQNNRIFISKSVSICITTKHS